MEDRRGARGSIGAETRLKRRVWVRLTSPRAPREMASPVHARAKLRTAAEMPSNAITSYDPGSEQRSEMNDDSARSSGDTTNEVPSPDCIVKWSAGGGEGKVAVEVTSSGDSCSRGGGGGGARRYRCAESDIERGIVSSRDPNGLLMRGREKETREERRGTVRANVVLLQLFFFFFLSCMITSFNSYTWGHPIRARVSRSPSPRAKRH